MTEGQLDGMVLAAVATDDQEGAVAGSHFSDETASRLRASLVALGGLERRARHDEIARCAAGLAEIDDRAELTGRIAGLLAPLAPRPVGRAWEAKAEKPRAGFAVDPALRATLRRLTRHVGEDCEAVERAVERSTAERDLLSAWVPLAAPDAPDADHPRVIGALLLGARGEPRGDARSTTWRRLGAELRRALGEAWPA